MILITALASFHSHLHLTEASIQFKDLTTAKVFKYRLFFPFNYQLTYIIIILFFIQI